MRDAAPCEQPWLQPRFCQVAADGGRVLLGGSWAAATDSTASAATSQGSTRHPQDPISYVRMGSAV